MPHDPGTPPATRPSPDRPPAPLPTAPDAASTPLADPTRLELLDATGLVAASAMARLPTLEHVARLAARATRAPLAQVNLVTADAQIPAATFLADDAVGADGAPLDPGGAAPGGAWRMPEERDALEAVAREGARALERARLFEAEHAARAEAERARAAADAERRRAEEANAAKGQFLTNMSHELRTPLNAIGGYAQLLEMGLHGPVTDAQREALVRVQRAQQHLLGLINDVLNFAKLDAGRVAFAPRAVPLAEAAAGAVLLVEPQCAAKGLVLAVHGADPAKDAPWAWVDPEKLAQVLLNLLSNAIKFTPPVQGAAAPIPGAPGRIDVAVGTCASDPTRVEVRVRDTGIGIAADKREAIFEPFVQVNAGLTRAHEGTGLGLAISRDLARAMGGDLAVERVPGAGSTFVLTLRRATAAGDGPVGG